MVHNIGLRLGIGDIILCKSLVLPSWRGSDINVCLKYAFLGFRGPNYREFITDFGAKVFYDRPFKFSADECPYPCMGWEELYRQGFRGCPINLDPLCKGETLHFPYICVNMKVRYNPLSSFLAVRDRFVSTLISLPKNIRIVFIGEREVEMNSEYRQFGNDTIFSVYPHLIGKIPNVVDLTVPKMGIVPPSMGKMRQDCQHLRGSIASINFGVGGNLVLSVAFAKRNINLFPRSELHDSYALCLGAMSLGKCSNYGYQNAETFLREIATLK